MNLSSVILRLYREFEHLVWFYRVPLIRPIVGVESMHGKFGEWNPEMRQIRLSDRLLSQYPWDVVVEILKHEMAHQIVSEVYQVAEQHGEFFQRACERLAVAGWARRASVDIGTVVDRNPKDQGADDATERLLRRAEKLLALANSDNENEALLAMQRVREIYARYNIEKAAEDKNDDYDYAVIYLKSKRIEQYQSMICNILNSFFFVKIIQTHYYDVNSGSEFKAIELLGNRPSVAMAEFVYHFLDRQLASLFDAYWRNSGSSTANRRTARRSFYLGVLKGFYEKLQRQKLGEVSTEANPKNQDGPMAAGAGALILVHDRGLESFFDRRYPKTRKAGWSADYGDRQSFNAGHKEGQSLNLRRPLASHSSRGGAFLPK